MPCKGHCARNADDRRVVGSDCPRDGRGRMQVYALFDQLLLLSEGQVVYFGLAQEAASYFGMHA